MKLKRLSLISVGFGAGPTPSVTSDRGWPSRMCGFSCLKSIPQDPPLHGMHVHAALSLPRVSLFSGNIANFSDPHRKDCVSFFCSCHRIFVTEGKAKSMLVFSQG